MKKNFLKNFYLFQLQDKSAIDVLKSSIGKVEDYELLDQIIANLFMYDIEEFLQLITSTTYDLNKTKLIDILLKYPINKKCYELLMELNFNPVIGDSIIPADNDLCLATRDLLLNYCYLTQFNDSPGVFEIFANFNILEGKINREQFEVQKYYEILLERVLNLYEGKFTQFNLLSLEKIGYNGKSDFLAYLTENVKDPLLKAILNPKGRVNGTEYPLDYLYLVESKQVYNLDIKSQILLILCSKHFENGRCTCCYRRLNIRVRNKNNTVEASQPIVSSSFNPSTQSNNPPPYDSDDFKILIAQLVENAFIDMDYPFIYKIFLHCSFLRTPKYFKVLLKVLISENKMTKKDCLDNEYQPNKLNAIQNIITSSFRPNLIYESLEDANPETFILHTVDLFDINDENETTAISFFKSSSNHIRKSLLAIPFFMKSKKLFFSCFVVLLQASLKNEYMKVLSKNIVYRYRENFLSIMDLIFQYYVNFHLKYESLYDKEFVTTNFRHLSDLFSEKIDDFIQKNGYLIFNNLFPCKNFTQEYIDQNVKFLVIHKILDSSFTQQADDVDILVGLLFHGKFNNLDGYFKPSANLYIKKNMSHILFKIKNAYSNSLYNRNTCIYKIITFILSQINIPLYFSYFWPYVEFFLNREYCECAGYFLEWLRAFYDSPLMVPYLITPFEKIEDLPILPNIEIKIYPILARYFYYKIQGKEKIKYGFSRCPFQEKDNSSNESGRPLQLIPTKDFVKAQELLHSDFPWSKNLVINNKFNINLQDNKFNKGFTFILPTDNTDHYKRIEISNNTPMVHNKSSLYPLYKINYNFDNKSVLDIYLLIKKGIPSYTPNPLIDDEIFIENFLYNLKTNKIFKKKIFQLHGFIPTETRALFGNLKYETGSENYPKAPADIPREILKNFLLKINYQRQDLFAFTIQEFLKNINGTFEPEIENFVQQFRHTKFENKFTPRIVDHLEFTSYRAFLESLFLLLHQKTKKYGFLKYIYLFDNSALAYGALCMVKIAYDEEYEGLNELFKGVDTLNNDILRFLLKINTFVGKIIISKQDIINYSLKAREYYSLIYSLEDEDTDYELLQIAYYMIGDTIKARGFNSIASGRSYSNVNLFFDFLLNKNYNAALSVLNGIYNENKLHGNINENKGPHKHSNLINNSTNEEKYHQRIHNKHKSIFPVQNFNSSGLEDLQNRVCNLSLNQKNLIVQKILREIVERNPDDEIETLISGKDSSCSGIIFHIIKDLELLLKSNDLSKTVKLINSRRKLAMDPDLILKTHKYLESKIKIDLFSTTVDQEMIKYLIRKKEYQKAEEEIAKFLLREDFSVLLDLANIKVETRLLDEAKEVLKRIQLNCPKNTISYFKATVKLCEISPSKTIFESSVNTLESTLNFVNSEDDNEIFSFKSQARAKTSILKLEDIYKKLKKIGERENNALDENYKQQEEVLSSDSIEDRSGKKAKKEDMANNEAFINQGNIGGRLSCSPLSASDSYIMSHIPELYNQLQRLYFLTAKYFEKHDLLISVKYYFKSLTNNYEAIPRFFHLIASSNRTHSKIIGEMIEIIKKEYLSNLIPFYNQISTKIALEAESKKFYAIIIVAMLEKFPYQTHWNSLFLYNSKKAQVANEMARIIDSLSFDRRRLFLTIKNCSENFSNIAKNPSKVLSMENFPEIRSLFPAQINIPGQMTEINNIKNEILIFRSLQSPKKIVLVGEDGVEYPMIVKFKDDLRKDSRFMDLDDLLNKIFDDGYYIRKYSVIPFNHESGIIQFIPNLINLKEIVSRYYNNINESLHRFIKTKVIGGNNMNNLLTQFKPVYLKYLKESYNNPYQFYKNRDNYMKTYAIMCIVGWFMGLGDRHAENIHFDILTGDTVHVDLNCIFEKGKSLEIPEKVPFRLTQNIIDGLGVLKLEGTFKHTMKYTLNLLKDNRDVIQANLLSFVFDPLFEWSRKKTEPLKILESLDIKLDFEDGNYKIDELINSATDIDNLGSMYIGWMSFL